VAVDHDRVRIYGGILTDVYDSVLQFAEDKGIEIYSMNSIQPSLEDAFIKITGLSPIVMAVEKGGR
jgi:ABC-2 type transport system ATP-binding protein